MCPTDHKDRAPEETPAHSILEGIMELKPGKYRHFKGKEYELIGLATHSETMEAMVVYRALYGEQGLWVRPAAMWTEWVDRGEYHGPRFRYIEEE